MVKSVEKKWTLLRTRSSRVKNITEYNFVTFLSKLIRLRMSMRDFSLEVTEEIFK